MKSFRPPPIVRPLPSKPCGVIEIDEDWIASGSLSPPEEIEDAIHIKPHEDDGGIQTGMALLRWLHDPQTENRGFLRGSNNISPVTSFELKYSKETRGFQFVPGSADLSNTIQSSLDELYPNSDWEQQEPQLLNFRSGRYVSATELTLDRNSLFPIKHVGFKDIESDPLGSIAAEIIGPVSNRSTPTEVTIQVILKPATKGWIKGVNGESYIANLKKPKIRNHGGKRSWWLNIRVIAESEDIEVTKRHAQKTAKILERYYLTEARQHFAANSQSGDALRKCVERAVRREYVSRSMIKTSEELAGVVHIPNGEINACNLDKDESKSEAYSTFRGELRASVGERQASRPGDGDEEKVTTLADIFQRSGLSETEANQKAERHVYGEVRSGQSLQLSDEVTSSEQPDPTTSQGWRIDQESSDLQANDTADDDQCDGDESEIHETGADADESTQDSEKITNDNPMQNKENGEDENEEGNDEETDRGDYILGI